MRVALLVNPVAGLGGPGAYKGSDLHWREALEAGYAPTAPDRARRFVAQVARFDGEVDWVVPPGALGLPDDAFPTAPERVLEGEALAFGTTTAGDTRRAAVALREAGVDLLCFVGGDGTATDVAQAVDQQVPCLGVPAGVKITSAVHAHDVEEAAWLVARLPPGFEGVPRDVTDLDEAAYRAGRVEVRLTGSLVVPLSPFVQGGKDATHAETPLDGLVEMVLHDWDPEALTVVGAGSVCRAVKQRFHGTATLLGADALQGRRVVAQDLDDRTLEALIARAEAEGREVRVVLSPIGGQGMLLGRGTQWLRPDLLRRIGWRALRVVAPPEKLAGVRALHVDTGDPGLDAAAPRHLRVVTGWNETRMVRVRHGAEEAEGQRAGEGGWS